MNIINPMKINPVSEKSSEGRRWITGAVEAITDFAGCELIPLPLYRLARARLIAAPGLAPGSAEGSASSSARRRYSNASC